jgi:hypothetical protein
MDMDNRFCQSALAGLDRGRRRRALTAESVFHFSDTFLV